MGLVWSFWFEFGVLVLSLFGVVILGFWRFGFVSSFCSVELVCCLGIPGLVFGVWCDLLFATHRWFCGCWFCELGLNLVFWDFR